MNGKEYIKLVEEQVIKTKNRNTDFTPLSENDSFEYKGEHVFSMLDLWRYSYCQVGLGDLSEFIVARALGVEKPENATHWTAYDMSYRNKRIEVKSTAYIHAWNKEKVSKNRVFSIEPSRNDYWLASVSAIDGSKQEYSRQSEVYVFAINADKDLENHNPFELDAWEFYVVPTFKINEYAIKNGNPNQKKIALGVVRKLAREMVGFDGLREAVDRAIDESDRYYIENYI